MRLSRPTALTPGRLPHVEVVVPCYNYGSYLPGCIASIVQQPAVRVTVTIVDDASPDGSGDVAQRIAEAHPNVKLIRNETNLGMVGTFNRGLKQVDSDYVVLISADDRLAPGSLARAAALIEANPRVGLVYGRTQKFADQPKPRPPMPTVTWTTWSGDDWISLQLHRGWSNIASPEAMVRTDVQHEVGYYDPALRHTLDVEMWLRIAAVSDVGHINGVDQAYYRRHPASYSSQFSAIQDIEERWKAYDQFLNNWSRPAQAAELRAVVRRRLADEALFDLLIALEQGPVDDAAAERTLSFAAGIDPEVVRRDQWADVTAARDGRPARAPGAVPRRASRSLAQATRWHRWRKFRYLG